MKKFVSILLILMLMISAVGCTTFDNFKNAFFSGGEGSETAKTIKIGVYEPLSGTYKKQGSEELEGIELAHSLYPSVLGYDVELIVEDNKSNIYDAETAINNLIETIKPSVIIGSYSDTLSLVASEKIKTAGIPAITISATNPLITINNNFYFMATYADEMEGDLVAEYIYETCEMKKAAVIRFRENELGANTNRRFRDRFRELAGQKSAVTANIIIDTGTTDFTEIIDQLKETKSEAVFLNVSSEEAREFLAQCAANDYTDVLFVGTSEWDDEAFEYYLDGQRNIGAAYPSKFAATAETNMSKTFLNAYHEKYGSDKTPTGRMAVAFDAYIMALEAIKQGYADAKNIPVSVAVEKATTEAEAQQIDYMWKETLASGIPTGRMIRRALSNLSSFEGASGYFTYNGGNEPTKTAVFNRINEDVKTSEMVILSSMNIIDQDAEEDK